MDRRRDRAVGNTPGLLAGATAMLLGAVLVQGLTTLPPRWLDALLVALAALGASAGGYWRAPRWLWCIPIVVLAFAWTAWRADLAMAARLSPRFEKQDLLVAGRVTGLPQAQPGATRFEFDVSSATLDGRPVPLAGYTRLSWYASRRHAAPAIRACTTWRLRVRLKRPHGFVNPGGLDFERSALQRGLVAQGYVREGPDNQRLASGVCVDGVRERVVAAIAAALPAGAHSVRLLRALSVGDERALDEHDWQVVRATGIAHLIAISGFHVGLAAVFGAWLVRLVWWAFPMLALRWARPLAEAAVAFPAALAYGALAGFGLPTNRTLLMIAVVVGWRLLRRNGGFGAGFGLALAAILIVDPLAVLSAGFWLSFGGVALLAWTLAQQRGWRGQLKEIGLAPLLMTLALLPLTVWFFGQASLVGPLANLVAVPIVSFLIVPLDLVGCGLIFAWPWAGRLVLHACAHLVDALWWLLAHLAAWPAATQYLPAAGLGTFALACVGAIWLLAPRGVPARALGFALLLPLCWPRTELPAQGAFRATVVDVGQGLAVLLRTRQHALLVDAGARYPSGFDLGEVAVVPTLHALGVDRLAALVISHGDNDHAGGATAVLAAYPKVPVWGGEPWRGPVRMRQCRAGQAWHWDGVAIRVLHPAPGAPARGNDAGCVLEIAGAGGRLLLPSDVSAKVEATLLAAVGAGPPLVLVVPHHGSKTSSSREFLRAIQPRFAIASAGYLNAYHHPAPVVRARYRELAIPFYNTADAGAVTIAFPADAAPYIVARERLRQHRYWRE